VSPGSITPLALMNDKERRVRVIVDEDVLKSYLMNCHPLYNTASTSLSPTDLFKFLEHMGYVPSVIDCAAVAPQAPSSGMNLSSEQLSKKDFP